MILTLGSGVDYLIGRSAHPLRQSKQIVLADPILQRVSKLP